MADDFSALYKLEADLRAAPVEARPFIRKAVQVTSHRIKDEWQAGANRTGLRAYSRDISYETHEKREEIGAEIGPTVGDSGSLGFVEEGGARVASAPQHAARDAVRNNEEDFVVGLERAMFDGIQKAVGG